MQSVAEQYHYGYVHPQESGTHVGLKWFRLTDDSGYGLEITSPAQFSASALPFTRQDLTDFSSPFASEELSSVSSRYSHSEELRPAAHEADRSRGVTHLNFDLVQRGLGCIDSVRIAAASRVPDSGRRLHLRVRHFTPLPIIR